MSEEKTIEMGVDSKDENTDLKGQDKTPEDSDLKSPIEDTAAGDAKGENEATTNGDFKTEENCSEKVENSQDDAKLPDDKDDLKPPTLDPTEDDDDKWNDNYSFTEDEKTGIDPNEKDPKKLILWAAQNNELEILRDLLEKDPSLINARDNDLYTPLHRAAYSNNVEVIKILLSFDADISAKTEDGWQPLHSACKWDSVEAVSLLIQNGANVNAQTNGHVTPLHLAAANASCRRTLELLLWHPHIDPNIKNDALDTPYDIACRSGPLGSLFEMLEESVNVY